MPRRKKKHNKNQNKSKKYIAKRGTYNIPSKLVMQVPNGEHLNQANPPEQNVPIVQPVAPEPPKPKIENFYTKLSERMDSMEITNQVRSEITDIIKAAGITEQGDIDKFVEKSYSDGRKHVNLIYDPKLVEETKMSVDVMLFFYTAYKSLEESDLSAANQIIAAQKITNVMIKNYSPVAFADKEFEHYGNDYVLNNREVLESQLEVLGFTNSQAIAEEVYATLRGEPIKRQEPPKEEPAVDPNLVDMAEFVKALQPILDNTEQYQGFNIYRKIAIKKILSESGVDVGEESDPLGYVDVIKDAYAPEKLSRENPQHMRDVSKSLFISTYNALTQKGINPADKIKTTQKLTNEFIAYYSPVFSNDNLVKYANNYVINDKELFRECLTTLKFPEKEIKTIVDDQIDGARLRNTVNLFMAMPSMTAKTRSNISDILKAAEVGADKQNVLEINEILADAYAPDKIPNASVPMRDVTKHVFIATYAAMTKKGVTPKDTVETAQKITDELLKNYSPIAYTDQKLNEYANNYVINDKELLRECLTALKPRENEIKAVVEDTKERKVETTDTKVQENVNKPQETKPVSDEVRVAVYQEKLKTYNNMYKLDIDGNNFVEALTESWKLMTSGDKQDMPKGKKIMNDIFKETLKKAFENEKNVAYDEHRLPEYAEIVKSTNELMRSAMYGFTDMYHNSKRAELFEATAFGGLNAKDMVELTVGQSLWSMDQKSDEAWDIQCKEAKNIADKWLKEDKPYEKMISEMKALVETNEKGIVSRKDMIDKLTAAEWLLVNNEKMMVEDPNDPLNPIPNWGNRYWKALSETREALGIDKHTSMRDMIQADYAASAKAVNNPNYNETQINNYVLDDDVRGLADSMDVQKEQFAIQGAAVELTKPQENKAIDDNDTEIRQRYPVNTLNQRNIMMNEPKYDNWVHLDPQRHNEFTITNQG